MIFFFHFFNMGKESLPHYNMESIFAFIYSVKICITENLSKTH